MKSQLFLPTAAVIAFFVLAGSCLCQNRRETEFAYQQSRRMTKTRNLTRTEINSLKRSLSKWIDEGKPSSPLFMHSESYPLEDIKACIPSNTDNITQTDEQKDTIYFITAKCPACGVPLVRMWFCSPDWTWARSCGRAGDLIICPKCGKNDLVAVHIMN